MSAKLFAALAAALVIGACAIHAWTIAPRLDEAYNTPAREQFYDLPASLVNGPAQRAVGPDGLPLIDHGDGW